MVAMTLRSHTHQNHMSQDSKAAGGFLQQSICWLSLGLLFNLGAAIFKTVTLPNRLWRIFFEA